MADRPSCVVAQLLDMTEARRLWFGRRACWWRWSGLCGKEAR